MQDLKMINKIVIPHFLGVLNLKTLLSQVPPYPKWFTIVNLCSASFIIPVVPNSQYLFAFKRNYWKYTWTECLTDLLKLPPVFPSPLSRSKHPMIPTGFLIFTICGWSVAMFSHSGSVSIRLYIFTPIVGKRIARPQRKTFSFANRLFTI